MTLPAPEPGPVIRYSYLWLREHREGREEGVKDRPCAVVLALTDDEGDKRVTVLPITYSPPDALRAQSKFRRRRNSVSVSTLSAPGSCLANATIHLARTDLRPLPGGDLGTVAYGLPPPRLFNIVRQRFVALARSGAARLVSRTE